MTPCLGDAPPAPIYGESLTLRYKDSPIRALMVNGVPWFALPDLIDAMAYHPQRAAALCDEKPFPPYAKLTAMEEEDPDIDGEPQDVTLLSPIGVFYWTHSADKYKAAPLAAWARREAQRLCPAPTEGDPAMFLQSIPHYRSGWDLPPRPAKYSGRLAEWCNLRDSGSWWHGPGAAPGRPKAA